MFKLYHIVSNRYIRQLNSLFLQISFQFYENLTQVMIKQSFNSHRYYGY